MKKYIFPTLTIICILIGFVIGNTLSAPTAEAQRSKLPLNTFYSQSFDNKIQQVLGLIDVGYVDPIDMDSINEEVIKEIIKQLDPHSSYISKEELEMVNSELSSTFSGIGIQFSIMNDTIQVASVISGGPSEGIGLLAGDKIVTVNDTAFTGKTITNERVMNTLRGPKNTQVKLGIKRQGCADILNFTITRGDIPVHSVDANFIIPTKQGDKIGFVRVSRFAENTYFEFITALAQLKYKGATSYIIDLRENTGGYMDQVILMVNEFLHRGDMIVYSEGRAIERYEATANGIGRFQKEKVVVLIDDFSASASEIFAGAIQDNDRGTIIGRRSFGKGLVQQQIPLDDGSAVRLTVARYYTPSGRCIQKPYRMGEQYNYEMELLDRYEHGEFFSQDSVHFTDTTAYYTKNGRKVMGGGGIMPDIFVGRDTTLYTPYFNIVSNLAYTYQFAYQYTDRHRQELNQYTTWQELEKHLLRANWVNEFIDYAQEKGIEPNYEEIAKSRPLLIRIVNAYIVRNILGDEGFYPLYERDDEITQRAVEALSK
ncbi:MAG: S41 family peptidase [Paludibacteraceae bacterium]|nr:S41 family peptidase [Paludibacteraceae bacterium]